MWDLFETIAALIAGSSLAAIQIRRIFRRELPAYGVEALKAASRMKLDKIDNRLLLISAVFFIIFLLIILIKYW